MNQRAATPSEASKLSSDQKFGRALVLSIALHLIGVAALTLRAVFYPSEAIDLQDSIRVDIVALPDKQASLPPEPVAAPSKPAPSAESPPPPEPPKETSPAKPEPPKTEAPKFVEKPKIEPKVDLKRTKQDQSAALKRIEALQKIQNMMKSKSAESASAVQPVKGNEVSKGDSLTGLSRIEHATYLSTIKARVKSQWNLPGWMATANLSTRIRLYVDGNGTIVKKAITKSSGNEEYDARAIGAVEAASPLPAPPSSLTNILAVDGIEIELVPD